MGYKEEIGIFFVSIAIDFFNYIYNFFELLNLIGCRGDKNG